MKLRQFLGNPVAMMESSPEGFSGRQSPDVWSRAHQIKKTCDTMNPQFSENTFLWPIHAISYPGLHDYALGLFSMVVLLFLTCPRNKQ